MNQTVTINISGIVFHIDVDAYEELKKYLNKIKSYFKNSEESEEIMTDIEARIAELFNEKITPNNQVIQSKDVDEVITVMGKPEQYVDEDEEQEAQSKRESFSSNQRTYTSEKKLFRDPDDRMIGGVAAGLAAYLGVEAIWLRLFFVVALFIGFGFVLYIILWIVMSEAKTISDKLHMKGEPVNIDNIGRTFKDEADKMSENFKKHGQQYGKKAETVIESFFNFIGQILKGVFNVLGKVFGVIFLLVGLVFITISVLWLTVGDKTILSITDEGVFSAVQSPELFDLIFPVSDMYQLFILILVVVISMPFVAIFYGGLKLLFNIKTHFSVGLSMFILWLISAICCVFIVFYAAKDQKSRDSIVEENKIENQYYDYNLTLIKEELKGDEILETNDFLILTTNDSIYMNRVSLDVKQSKTNDFNIQVKYKSRGFSSKKARENAAAITYNYEVRDSVISFSEFISMPKEDRMRAQKVQITVQLPIGKTIYFDNSIKSIMYDVDNVTTTHDRNMLGKRWVMLEEGLTCLDCEDIEGVTTSELDSIRSYKTMLVEDK